jgi:glutathione synthase/RimK-type ligase-like ATP-grasp enzyme
MEPSSIANAAVAVATSGTAHGDRADRPLIAALERAGCAAAAKRWDDPGVDWSAFAACVVRSTWNWHLEPDRFREWIRRVSGGTLLLNDAATLLWGLNKRYLLDLEAAGVPIVPTVVVGASDRSLIPAIAARKAWGRFVVKPTLGASAYRVQVIEPKREDANAWARNNGDFPGPVLVQPYVDSVRTAGEVSVVVIDGHPSHAVRKVPAAGDFRVQVEFGGREELVPISPGHRQAAERCYAAIPGRPIYARIDLVESPDQLLWVSECEVVEPELFLDRCPEAAERLAGAVLGRIRKRPPDS